MRLKADLTLFFISIVWGSAFVAQRVAGQMGSVYLFNGARYALAALVVLPFAVRQNKGLTLGRPQRRWMLIAGSLLFVASVFQQMGLVYTTAGNAGFITSLYVVLVPMVLWIGWRERLDALAMLSVGMAGAGAFLLSTGGRLEVRVGDALELIGALFWALHVVLLGKFASRFESISFSAGQLAICGVLNFGVGLILERPVFAESWPVLTAIVYTAVFSLGAAYTLQVWAQRHTPPTDAALILSLESVFSVIAGWVLLGERLLPVQAVGCAIIFAAVILSQWKGWGKIGAEGR